MSGLQAHKARAVAAFDRLPRVLAHGKHVAGALVDARDTFTLRRAVPLHEVRRVAVV